MVENFEGNPHSKHAWFSPSVALKTGTSFWYRPNGSKVEVTEVSERPTSMWGAADATYLGRVYGFSHAGRSPSLEQTPRKAP